MPFCDGIDQALGAPILLEPLFNLRVRGPGTLQIAFVHDHDIGQIEHHDFL